MPLDSMKNLKKTILESLGSKHRKEPRHFAVISPPSPSSYSDTTLLHTY